MNPLVWAKSHPLQTGAIVIIGGILFFVIATGGGGGGSTTAASPTGPSDDALLAASTSIQMAQISAGAASSQVAAELEAARIAAGVKQDETSAAKDVALAQLASNQIISLADIQANITAADFAYKAQVNNTGAQLSALQIASNERLGLQQIETDASRYNTTLQYNAAIHSMNIQHSENERQAQLDQELGLYTTSQQSFLAQQQQLFSYNANYQAQKNSSKAANTQALVSGVTTAAMMFSDESMKKPNKKAISKVKGAPTVYEWEYYGSSIKEWGPMAQDVLDFMPSRVGADNGNLTLRAM